MTSCTAKLSDPQDSQDQSQTFGFRPVVTNQMVIINSALSLSLYVSLSLSRSLNLYYIPLFFSTLPCTLRMRVAWHVFVGRGCIM